MRILVVDNYDSFTWNLVHYLGELGASCEVVRNDALTVDDALAHPAEAFLVSPGPGAPVDAGISVELVRRADRPLLGVCLGHQAIGEASGGTVVRASRRMHGRTSPILHEGAGVFRDLPSPFEANRYHSLLVERATLPAELAITAWTAEGEIMGLRHRTRPVEGVQFHPESFFTPLGKRLLATWLELARAAATPAGGGTAP